MHVEREIEMDGKAWKEKCTFLACDTPCLTFCTDRSLTQDSDTLNEMPATRVLEFILSLILSTCREIFLHNSLSQLGDFVHVLYHNAKSFES